MNVLMVHPHDIFDKAEPWTIRVKSFASEIIKFGHKVKLCYFPLSINSDYKSYKTANLDIIPFNRTPSPLVFIKNTVRFIKMAKWADVIHLQKCHHYASIPIAIAAYVSGKPLHYDWDDWEERIWYESMGRGLHSQYIGLSFKVLERFLPLLSDTVSCASESLKVLSCKFGVKKENIFSTPVGVDLKKFSSDANGSTTKEKYKIKKDLVLYVGQLHGAQYVDLFIKAANFILHKNKNVKFMIVGEGFLAHKLRKLSHDLGIEEYIIFAGGVSHDDIPKYIAAATVCVAPFRDTKVTRCKSPLKILEYMASQKPIVVSRIGEIEKMVGDSGIIVEPGDYYALASGILNLLSDSKLRENLGIKARKKAEKEHSWENGARELLSAYEKIKK